MKCLGLLRDAVSDRSLVPALLLVFKPAAVLLCTRAPVDSQPALPSPIHEHADTLLVAGGDMAGKFMRATLQRPLTASARFCRSSRGGGPRVS